MIAICACGGRKSYIYAWRIPEVNQDSRCRVVLIPLLEGEQDLDGGSGGEGSGGLALPTLRQLEKCLFAHIWRLALVNGYHRHKPEISASDHHVRTALEALQ